MLKKILTNGLFLSAVYFLVLTVSIIVHKFNEFISIYN